MFFHRSNTYYWSWNESIYLHKVLNETSLLHDKFLITIKYFSPILKCSITENISMHQLLLTAATFLHVSLCKETVTLNIICRLRKI